METISEEDEIEGKLNIFFIFFCLHQTIFDVKQAGRQKALRLKRGKKIK